MEGKCSNPPRNQSFEIILGSSSVARRLILAEMGYDFTILTADIDEKSIRKENPEDLVTALAEAKADAIMMKLNSSGQLKEMLRPTLLLTADTVVVYEGNIREKASSEEEARQFIRDYSGSSAKVVGSVLVSNLLTGRRVGGWESAEVYLLDIPDEVIDSLDYFQFVEIDMSGIKIEIEEGIVFNVAGGLMLEHPLVLPLVDTVVGSYDCVMGLSKALTEKLIQDALIHHTN